MSVFIIIFRCLTANREFVPSEQWGWIASSHLQCSHTSEAVMQLGPSHLWPSTLTFGRACTPLLAGERIYWHLSCQTRVWFSWNSSRVVHGVSRLLKACGSRLTEKLLEGAPTEDTLVLIEKQTGSHAMLNHTHTKKMNCVIQPETIEMVQVENPLSSQGFERVHPTAKVRPLDAEWHHVSVVMCLNYATRLP